MRLLPDLFHVAAESDWDEARRTGSYDRSTRTQLLAEVGFVHLSFAWQVAGTLQRFYAGDPGPLVLLCLSADGLPVRVEDGFPHLYTALPVEAVSTVLPLEPDGDSWSAPPSFSELSGGLA